MPKIKTLKILFLDIDGVLNNYTTKTKYRGCTGLDNTLIPHVKRIIKETKCKVVLSSTWRRTPALIEYLKRRVCPILDSTPIRKFSSLRGEEVQWWLRNSVNFVSRYAILDDDSGFLDGQYLFHVDGRDGITSEIADAVITHLNS